ncbi:MAG: disulfide bond formation protein B [Dehalococcoidia bacterium]|nr:disulfide bond formation protein B [Dehalococcoidia bacterium]
MSESTVSPVLALLALAVGGGSLVLALGAGAPAAVALRGVLLRYGRWMAFAVAAVAVATSLYYSESAGFVPCDFCWYQRIAMYPLALVLLVGAVTRDPGVTKYAVPLAGIGLLLSLYHYQLQLFPEQSTVCTSGVPCTARYVEQFGFVSIPFMAGCAFLAVLALHLAMWRARRAEA